MGSNPTPSATAVRHAFRADGRRVRFVGVIWVAFDPRKQGWHDKMAHTLVVPA